LAAVVDDPSVHPEKFPTEEAQQRERERLFDIILRQIRKKLRERSEVYALAGEEMLKHTGGKRKSPVGAAAPQPAADGAADWLAA
jgi:putative DNA methylase